MPPSPRRPGPAPLLALAALALAGCSEARRPSPPHVLVVTLDTLRADHCSAYGYRHETTPRLTRLAAEGARAELAYAPMATTGPSHCTLFTGLHPASHGVLKNGWVLPPGRETLAETMRAAGYATAAFVSAFPVNRRFGLGQGFEAYDDDFGPRTSEEPTRWEGRDVTAAFERTGDVTAARVVAWLRGARPRQRPFFLWVHLFDPHAPYTPPAEYLDLVRPRRRRVGRQAERDVRWRYDGEVRFVDSSLGRILDALEQEGLAGRTLVVVVGDHGEALGEHGHTGHGLTIYEEAVRVPLVVRFPGRLRPGLVVPGPVPMVDLRPTILELALGLPPDPGGQGRSQAPVLLGAAASDLRRAVFLQRRFYEPESRRALGIAGDKLSVRVGDWKYLAAEEEGTRELYDLRHDPGETENLAATRPAEAAFLAATLGGWREGLGGPSRQAVSPDDEEALRALGYLQ